jgi:hypothetical protein
MDEDPKYVPAITPVLPNIKPPELPVIDEKAQKRLQEAVQLAKEHRKIITQEPTLLENISEKIKSLNNAREKMTTSVGLGAAAFHYYEAFEAFITGNMVVGWLKIGQGTVALVIGIISRDPQLISNKKG